MALPTEIQIAPLDFDTIKTSLRQFLQNQTALQDYNFEGSTLSLLLDVLATDAYYHGWYTNFAVNEVFLQTAQLRTSVVAAARQLGYVPRSVSSSVATVDITVGGVGNSSSVTLARYTPFTSVVNGQTYTFYTVDDVTQGKEYSNTSIVFSDVLLYEGVKLQQTFTVSGNTSAGYSATLLNKNVDTRTLTVSVKLNANSDTSFTYDMATSALTVNSTSNVFFLFETNDETWEVRFGDGVLGRALSAGQVVTVDYLDSRADLGNGANTFTFNGNTVGGSSNVTARLADSTVTSAGGAEREDLESIKRNAPAMYQTQGRIVTAYDCRSILLNEVGGIDSVAVWGGEDNDPPTYGKIFISIKPTNAETLGATQRTQILNQVLKPKSLPIVGYEFVDPDYVYILLDSVVRYSPARTSLTAEDIRQKVVNAVSMFAETELGQFGSYFRYSQVVRAIDDADPSIQSNLTTLRLEKRMTINTSVTTYSVKFSNELYTATNNAFVSSQVGTQTFTYVGEDGNSYTGCFVENANLVLNVYRTLANGTKELVKGNVGTINATTGVLSFAGFAPTSITTTPTNILKVRAIPAYSDIVPNREQIVLLPEENVTINVVDDLTHRLLTTFNRTTAGAQSGGGGYTVSL